MLTVYLFCMQLGSILGLILGGYITQGIGWRWLTPIVSIACGVLIIAFAFAFDDTMFPRYRFKGDAYNSNDGDEVTTSAGSGSSPDLHQMEERKGPLGKSTTSTTTFVSTGETTTGQILSIPPLRTYLQQLAPVHYLPDNKTTFFQYFRRPFYLFLFPNIVLAGLQFAFAHTGGKSPQDELRAMAHINDL